MIEVLFAIIDWLSKPVSCSIGIHSKVRIKKNGKKAYGWENPVYCDRCGCKVKSS